MMNSFAESGKSSTVVLPSSFDSKSQFCPTCSRLSKQRRLGGIADA